MLIPAPISGVYVVPISVATITTSVTARQAAISICGVQNRGLTDSGDQRLILPITSGAAVAECAPLNYLADLVGREWPIVIDTRNRIAWFSDNGADMAGIETEEQLGDFCGRMGRINLDRGVNSDAMSGDEYWAAILQAAKL